MLGGSAQIAGTALLVKLFTLRNFGRRLLDRLPMPDKVYELYDEYCHGFISRREFFDRAAKVSVAGVSALAMAEALLPAYAEAQTGTRRL